MCKLAASVNLEVNKLQQAEKAKINKVLEHLFYVNSFGQTDGSGLMLMTSDGKYGYHKRAIPSPDFIQTKWYQGLKSMLSDSFALGMHTRYSTVGGNSDENSHPFKHGKYLLMQNGTIARGCNHKDLVPTKKSPCDVDSESVCWSMAEQGIDKTFDEYEGAGVFMFFDTAESTFNIVKNDERTLFKAKVQKKEIYIFATEYDSLALAFTRAGLGFDYINEVTNDTLHTWSFNDGYTSRYLAVDDGWSSYQQTHYTIPNKSTPKGGNTTPVGKPQSLGLEDFSDPFLSSESVDGGNYVDSCAICGDYIFSNENHFKVEGGVSMHCCEDCERIAINDFEVTLTPVQGVQ